MLRIVTSDITVASKVATAIETKELRAPLGNAGPAVDRKVAGSDRLSVPGSDDFNAPIETGVVVPMVGAVLEAEVERLVPLDRHVG